MRRFVTLAALAAAAMATTGSAVAQEQGQYTVSIQFFSDATLTQQVGYARPHCDQYFAGATMQWGYSTQHRIETQGPLCVDGEFVYE